MHRLGIKTALLLHIGYRICEYMCMNESHTHIHNVMISTTTTTKPTIITIHQKPGGNITNVKQINKRKKNWMKWNELDWVENTTHTHTLLL